MTGVDLPWAATIGQRILQRLRADNHTELADDFALLHRATFDLVHAVQAEHEATTTATQTDARLKRRIALYYLRTGGNRA